MGGLVMGGGGGGGGEGGGKRPAMGEEEGWKGREGAKGRKAFYYCTGFGVDLMN
jgi:hypothetical protein